MQCAQDLQVGIGRPGGLSGVKRGSDFLEPARVERHPDPRRRQGRVRGNKFGGQSVEPPAHRFQLPGVEVLAPVRRHQPSAERDIARGDRVADRLGRIAVVLIPLRRPLVQRRRLLRCRARKLMAQQPGEEVVVPEPAVLVVQRDQEQVGTMDFADEFCAVGPSRERVAQRCTHAVEDRGQQQEVTHAWRLARQHLLAEIVDNVPVCAREALDECRRVGPVLQAQRRELQACRPSFGPRQQPVHVLLGQLRPKPAAEEFTRLVEAEPQMLGSHFGEFPAHPQPAQLQRWVGTRDEHQVQRGWAAVQQRGDQRVDLCAGDQVIVVQHEHQGSV